MSVQNTGASAPVGFQKKDGHAVQPAMEKALAAPRVLLREVAKRTLFRWLEGRGYDMFEPLSPAQRASREACFAAEREARARYDALSTVEKAERPGRLEAKYRETPVLGEVSVYDALLALAPIIDPLDPYLGAVSQLTHQLHLTNDVDDDGLGEAFVVCALIHDIGKLLIKYGDEDPINVEASGKKVPLRGEYGGGLLNCTFRWDHGDFAYLRFKEYVAPEISWLLRHHSIDIPACAPYMNAEDRAYTERYLITFTEYDSRKNMFEHPKRQLDDYRPLLERTFPHKILI